MKPPEAKVMKLVRTYMNGGAFACFDCRKSFKRNRPVFGYFDKTGKAHSLDFRVAQTLRQQEPPACPECRKATFYMGKDFKAPRTSDIRGWKSAEAHIRSGNVYYRGSQMDLGNLHFYQKRDQLRSLKQNGFVTPSQDALSRRYWADYQNRKDT